MTNPQILQERVSRDALQPNEVAEVRQFRVFLSYSHTDAQWARWLMRKLEGYSIPRRFHGRMAPIGQVGPRIAPVFRDRDELPTASDLGMVIRKALQQSATLVVICSPASARSRWVDEEIQLFKRLHGEDRVFAFIVGGEPKIENAADDCFPRALRLKIGDGALSTIPTEVIAADARPIGDGREVAFVRLVAGLIDVGFDELQQRELQRRNQRLTRIAVGAALGMAVTVGLAVVAWRARNEAVLAGNEAMLARNEAQSAERRAASEATRANSEASISKAVNNFLVSDLLRQADSRAQADGKIAPNPDLKVRDALDRAGEKVGTRFESEPLTEAAVRDAIGSAYGGVGDYAKAPLHLERALQLRKRALGAEHSDTLASMANLARAYIYQGKYPEGAVLYAQTLELQKRVRSAEHPSMLAAMAGLASAYHHQGKYSEALALHSQTLEIRKRVFGPEHPDTLGSMVQLANAYYSLGNYAEFEAITAQTLEIRKRVFGPEHPDTLVSMNNLANALYVQNKFAEAAALQSQTLEGRKRVFGAEHPETLTSMNNLAATRYLEKNFVEAAALFFQILEIRKRVLGPEHPNTLNSMRSVALAYDSGDRLAEAGALFAEVWEIRKRVLGAEHPDTLSSMRDAAVSRESGDRLAEAAALHAQTLEIRKRVLGAEHPNTLHSRSDLARSYRLQGNFAEALALESQTLEIRKRVLGAEHLDTLSSMTEIGRLLLYQKKHIEAETGLREALAILEKKRADDWETFNVRSLLGGTLAGQKQSVEAEPLLISGYDGMKQREGKMSASSRVRIKEALERLVKFYTDAARPEKVREWQTKLDEHIQAEAAKKAATTATAK